jgi:tetratricopeptide (TPR) repeat protein
MPLVNSVVKAVVSQHLIDHVILKEIDTDEIYEFSIKDPDAIIPGEVLHIRVEGMQKNLEVGRRDRINGVVVESSLDPAGIMDTGSSLSEIEVWDPEFQYGKKAAAALFPFHAGKKFTVFKITDKERDVQNLNETFRASQEALRNEEFPKAETLLKELLGLLPYDLDLLRILGYLYLHIGKVNLAARYFQLGINLVQAILPEDASSMILPGKYSGNFMYLSYLNGMGFMLEKSPQPKEALPIYRKCYQLDPMDGIGVRFGIHRITHEKLPVLDPQSGIEIDPYMFTREYDIPIRDVYDPNTRLDPKKWLSMSETYQFLLISKAHASDPAFKNAKPEQLQAHLILHHITESTLASNIEPHFRLSLARMVAQGYSRHEAVHLLGQQLLRMYQDQSDAGHDHHEHGPDCGCEHEHGDSAIDS